MPEYLMSLAEVVRFSGLSRTSIYNAINAGQLVARKFGTKTVVFESDFNEWLKSFPTIKPRP